MRIVAIGLTLLLATPAYSQVKVEDDASLLSQAKSLAQDLKGYATQLQQYASEAQTAVSTGEMVAGMIAHPSLGAAASLMQMTGLSDSLPVNPQALVGLTSGGTSISSLTGKLGQLGSLSGSAFSNNNVYTCQDQSWTCAQQQLRANGIAGLSGVAQAGYADLRAHLATIQALQDQAANTDTRTPAQREAIMTELQVEQTWTQNQQAQLAAAQMQAQSDAAAQLQKQHERTSQDLQATITDLQGG